MARRRNILLAIVSLIIIYTFLPSSSSPSPISSQEPLSITRQRDLSSPIRHNKQSKDRSPLRPPRPNRPNEAQTPSLSRPPPPPPTYLSSFVPSTRLESSIQGYNIFTNLYLHKGRLIFAPSSEDEMFETFDIADVVGRHWEEASFQILEPVNVDGWWYSSMSGDEANIEVYEGDTLVFNDQPGPAGYLVFHDNFATEALLAALKALSRAPPSSLPSPNSKRSSWSPQPELTDVDLQRVAFPGCGSGSFPSGWKDEKNQNEKLIKTVAPHASILASADWLSSKPKLLERVVFIDRKAAHRHPDTSRWSKMIAHIAVQSSPVQDWFASYRSTAIETHGLQVKPVTSKPVVIYVDRNKNLELPRLTTDSHLALIKSLRTIASKVEVHVTVLSNMLLPETIEILARATVIISVTTPDLRDAMWMPANEQSTVVELMDKDSFIRDNELLCEMVGHSHVLIRKNEVLPRETWLEMTQVRSPNFYGEIEVDSALVVDQVKDILGIERETWVVD